jgi:hypothetical protein
MRFFLRITTLSEIVDGSGQFITEDAWAGRVSPDRKTKLLYPRQDDPGKTALMHFRKAIKPLLVIDENRNMKKLRNPLGEWTNSPRLSEWECYFPWLELACKACSRWIRSQAAGQKGHACRRGGNHSCILAADFVFEGRCSNFFLGSAATGDLDLRGPSSSVTTSSPSSSMPTEFSALASVARLVLATGQVSALATIQSIRRATLGCHDDSTSKSAVLSQEC